MTFILICSSLECQLIWSLWNIRTWQLEVSRDVPWKQDLCAFLSAFLSHFPLILWCTLNNTVRVSEVSSDFSVGNKDRKRRAQEVQLLGELDSDISTKHLKAAPNLPPSVSWDRRAWMPFWIPVTEAMATLPSPRTISGLQLCSVMMNKAMSVKGERYPTSLHVQEHYTHKQNSPH